jgi:hypothetical protein
VSLLALDAGGAPRRGGTGTSVVSGSQSVSATASQRSATRCGPSTSRCRSGARSRILLHRGGRDAPAADQAVLMRIPTSGGPLFSATFSSPLPENRSEMRFLWTYLILAIVFAFGFVCASTLMVGMPPPCRPIRRARSNR